MTDGKVRNEVKMHMVDTFPYFPTYKSVSQKQIDIGMRLVEKVVSFADEGHKVFYFLGGEVIEKDDVPMWNNK